MPIYKVELERHVSRVVELRQTTSAFIVAPDLMTANDAAHAIARDADEIEKYADEWRDDDASRQASNDEEDRRPSVQRTYPIRFIGGGLPGRYAHAIEILNLDPNDYKE